MWEDLKAATVAQGSSYYLWNSICSYTDERRANERVITVSHGRRRIQNMVRFWFGIVCNVNSAESLDFELYFARSDAAVPNDSLQKAYLDPTPNRPAIESP